MNLHHQPVFQAHARHLGQHLRAEEFLLAGIGRAGQHPAKERLSLCRGKVGGLRGGMPVVGRRAAHRAEAQTRLGERVQIARPRCGVLSVLFAQLRYVFGKSRELRIDNRIGPEGGQNSGLPVRLPDYPVIVQRIKRGIGCRQNFNVETLIKSARQKLRCPQLFRNRVEVQVRSGLRQPLLQAKKFLEGKIQPHARRRSAEEIVMAGEDAPHLARVLQLRLPDFKILHGNALAVEHPIDVVIGLHKQLCRVGEGLVFCKP